MIRTVELQTNSPVANVPQQVQKINPAFYCPIPMDMVKTREFTVYVRKNWAVTEEIESLLSSLENSTSMKPSQVMVDFLYLCHRLDIQLHFDQASKEHISSLIQQELRDIADEESKLSPDSDLFSEITFGGTCIDILSGWVKSFLSFLGSVLMFFLILAVHPSALFNDYSASGSK